MVFQDDIPDEEIIPDKKLPEDYDTPFSDPEDVNENIAPDAPPTDTGIEVDERYQHGLPEAAGTDDGTDTDIEKGEKVG